MKTFKLGKLLEGGETSCISVIVAFFAIGFAIPGIIGTLEFIWMIFWHGMPAALTWAKTDENFLLSLLVLLVSGMVITLDVMISAKIRRSIKTSHDRSLKNIGRDHMAEALAEMSQNLKDDEKVKFYEEANKRLRDKEGPEFRDYKPKLNNE